MSAFPRIVLAGVTVTWDSVTRFVSAGTAVDVPPGSALEAAYGPSNLSPVIEPDDPRRAAESCDDMDKSALAN